LIEKGKKGVAYQAPKFIDHREILDYKEDGA